MKRNFDLIREILISVEENAKANDMYFPKIEGFLNDEISYNIRLLADAGFLELHTSASKSYVNYVRRLTYNGHEFLDNIKSPQVWEKTKKTAIEKVGVLTIEVLKTISTSIVNSILEKGL